jgi:hypothetical protein
MDENQRKALREKAKKATPGEWTRTRDNGIYAGKPKRCIGSMYDSEYVVAANPTAVLALLDESDWLRNEKWKYEGEAAQLREQLSAMTAARDEACDLAMSFDLHGSQPYECERLLALRKVGS